MLRLFHLKIPQCPFGCSSLEWVSEHGIESGDKQIPAPSHGMGRRKEQDRPDPMSGALREVGDGIVDPGWVIREGDRFCSKDQDAGGYEFLYLCGIVPCEGSWVSCM